MNARDYYKQAHEIPEGIVDAVHQLPIDPHAEDSGPTGRPCFRLGTYRNRQDVVCRYPQVAGELDFWAVSPVDDQPVIGEEADAEFGGFIDSHRNWRPYPQTPENLPLYKSLKSKHDELFEDYRDSHADWTDWETGQKFLARIYPPKVRCSRLAFVGGLGYEAGRIAIPSKEHPTGDAPTPSSETMLGWYGFDASNRNPLGDPDGGGLIPQYWDDGDWADPVFTEEGWGRPAFDFTPLASHARQTWAYAPATKSWTYDVPPKTPDFDDNIGITTIKRGSWESADGERNAGLPKNDIHFTNWWLLAMIKGDPTHGKYPVPHGKAIGLYWNPELVKSLTFFGENPSEPNLSQQLYQTILYRIYKAHCKTSAIDPQFLGVPFPPGFMVDVRILAETWECKCARNLWENVADYSPSNIKVFKSIPYPEHTLPHNPAWALDYIYVGTHFKVLYRCPFPIWRRSVA